MLKITLKRSVVSALATFGLIGGTTPAQAVSFFCLNCATQTTAVQILDAINTARTEIISAIKGGATTQSTATGESAKIIADANIKTSAEMAKVNNVINGEPLDPCGVTAAARGGGAPGTSRPSGGGRTGGDPSTAGATSDMQRALKISSGTVAAPAPEIAAAIAAKGACGTFAKDGLRAEACRSAGFSPGASSGFPDADIQAETLFDGPQTSSDKAAGIKRKLTIKSGNSAERTAIESFIRNLETPLDLRTLTANEINSEAGRNYMALRDSYDAVISLATKPVRDQQSLITANPLTLPILRQLAKSEDANYITTRLNASYPAWRTDGVSFAELMQLEADRRYLNEDWHVRMAGANEKQLMAEQVQLQALHGWMNVAMLERAQQQAILQGTTAGAALRSEKMPQLIAAHRAAKR